MNLKSHPRAKSATPTAKAQINNRPSTIPKCSLQFGLSIKADLNASSIECFTWLPSHLLTWSTLNRNMLLEINSLRYELCSKFKKKHDVEYIIAFLTMRYGINIYMFHILMLTSFSSSCFSPFLTVFDAMSIDFDWFIYLPICCETIECFVKKLRP